MDSELLIILRSIESHLESIAQSLIIKRDSNVKIRSDLQSGSSDQIRSDQISNFPSNLLEKFHDLCNDLGINYLRHDISGMERNVAYLLDNLPKISNKKAYINKILASCPEKVVGFTSHPKPAPCLESKPDVPENTDVYGVPIAEIEEMKPYFDEHVWSKTLPFIKTAKSMFSSWEVVADSEMKTNVCIALAILNDCY